MARPTGRRAWLRLEFLEDRLAPAGLADPPQPLPADSTTGVSRPAEGTTPASDASGAAGVAAASSQPGTANGKSTSAAGQADTGTDFTDEATEYRSNTSNGTQSTSQPTGNAPTAGATVPPASQGNSAPAAQTDSPSSPTLDLPRAAPGAQGAAPSGQQGDPPNEYSPTYTYQPPPGGNPYFVPAATAIAAWYPSYDPPAARPERGLAFAQPTPVAESPGRGVSPPSEPGPRSPGVHHVLPASEPPEAPVAPNQAPALPPDAPAAPGPGPGPAAQHAGDAGEDPVAQQPVSDRTTASLDPESAQFLAEVLPAEFIDLEAGLNRLLTRLESAGNEIGTSVRFGDLAPWLVGVSGVVAAAGLARRRRRASPAARLETRAAVEPHGGAGA